MPCDGDDGSSASKVATWLAPSPLAGGGRLSPSGWPPVQDPASELSWLRTGGSEVLSHVAGPLEVLVYLALAGVVELSMVSKLARMASNGSLG